MTSLHELKKFQYYVPIQYLSTKCAFTESNLQKIKKNQNSLKSLHNLKHSLTSCKKNNASDCKK
jgi:hypothetical protein